MSAVTCARTASGLPPAPPAPAFCEPSGGWSAGMFCDMAAVCCFWAIELANIKPTMNPSRIPMIPKSRFSLDIDYVRSEEHTSELQSRLHLVCRLLLEKKKT